LAAQVNTGGVLSTTEMLRLHVATFPQSSWAVQVRVMLYAPAQAPGSVRSIESRLGEASQLSITVTTPKSGTAGQLMVAVTVGQVMVGGVLSATEMTLLQVETFPQSSVADQVRVIVKLSAQLPATFSSVKVITGLKSQTSTAVAAPKFGTLSHSIKGASVGQVITGAVLSTTTMVRLHVDLFPQSSSAVQVLFTVYSCGHIPGVVWSKISISTLGSQPSTAKASPKFGTFGHSIIGTTVGQVITGGVRSRTVMVRLQVAEFPQASVAAQVRVTLYSCAQLPGVVLSVKEKTGLGSQLSVAVAVPKMGSAGQKTSAFTVGQVITGGRLSVTETVRLQVAELPQSSTAVQVRVRVNACGQVPATLLSTKVTTGFASQASKAVAALKLGNCPQSMIAGGFGQVNTGAVLSVTVTLRLHVELLPQSSVAVQVRVMLYSCGQVPGVLLSANVRVGVASQSSVAVAVSEPKLAIAGHSTLALTVGQVITGGVSSTTVMVRLQVAELPQSSIATQVLVTTYSCAQGPAVLLSVNVTVGVASQRSVAVAGSNTGIAGHEMLAWTIGQVIVGAVLSSTEILRLQVAEFPQASVTVQVRVTTYSCGQVPFTLPSIEVIMGAESHASVAVATPKFGVAGHSIGETGDGQTITGAVLSVTDIVRLQVAVLLQSSVTNQVRVMLNSCGQTPPGMVMSVKVTTKF
jgi:hypothetical protein